MRVQSRVLALSTIVVALFGSASAVFSKITRDGKYLYKEDGTRWSIKGVVYQPQGIIGPSSDNKLGGLLSTYDPLADSEACKRDVPYLSKLGANVITVYSVNASLEHDDCMQLLSDAGIYTIIHLGFPPNASIERIYPAWSSNFLDHFTSVIDAFSGYDNVLVFNLANEAVESDNTDVATFVKAAARDVRAHLKSISSSAFLGYSSTNGTADFLKTLATYLTCDLSGSDAGSTAIDLFGVNNYEGISGNITSQTYAASTEALRDLNAVVYLSETGSVQVRPRTWTEAEAVFGPDMSPVWTGMEAMSYFPTSGSLGQLGLVDISTNGTVTTSPEFDALQAQYSKAPAPPTSPPSPQSAQSNQACPTVSDSFKATTNLPPTPNEAMCNCVEAALSCQFKPQSSNYSVVLSQTIDKACGQVSKGCGDIASDGTSGVYGPLSGCDRTVKASYEMTLWYEQQTNDPAACHFDGNGVFNNNALSSAADALSSCLSTASPTPAPTSSAPSTAPTTSTNSSGEMHTEAR